MGYEGLLARLKVTCTSVTLSGPAGELDAELDADMTDNVYYLRFDDEVAKEREDWGSEVPEGFPTMQIVGLVLTALAVYWLYRKVKGNSVVHLLHLPGLWRVAILPN